MMLSIKTGILIAGARINCYMEYKILKKKIDL